MYALLVLVLLLGAALAIDFWGSAFVVFPREKELGEGRVVAKESHRVVAKVSHSLFDGLQLSTQAKWYEMRPCPASKKTRGKG